MRWMLLGISYRRAKTVRLGKFLANRNSLRGRVQILYGFLWRILLGAVEALGVLIGWALPRLIIKPTSDIQRKTHPIIFGHEIWNSPQYYVGEVRLRKCPSNHNAIRGRVQILDGVIWRILLWVVFSVRRSSGMGAFHLNNITPERHPPQFPPRIIWTRDLQGIPILRSAESD